MHIEFSSLAAQDIRDILQYTLEQWGEEQLEKYASILERAMRRLEDNPHLGRQREDLYHGCRSIPVEQHVIFYAVSGDTISIARILHGKMDTKSRV